MSDKLMSRAWVNIISNLLLYQLFKNYTTPQFAETLAKLLTLLSPLLVLLYIIILKILAKY